MNEKMKVFEYGETPVRAVMKDGEPWWVLADVCRVLDIKNSTTVSARLHDDEKRITQILTHSGSQKMIVVSESGLYSVLLRSTKPEAKPFHKWVTSLVDTYFKAKKGSYCAPEEPEVIREMVADLEPDSGLAADFKSKSLSADALADCMQLAEKAAKEWEAAEQKAADDIVRYAETPESELFQDAVKEHRAATALVNHYRSLLVAIKEIAEA